MTLVGKILIVVILVMSLIFMTFSLMLYATHKNWRDLVKNPTPSAGKPKGLELQLRDAEEDLRRRQEEMDSLRYSLSMERAARTSALANLESLSNQRQTELDDLRKQRDDLRAQQGDAIRAMELAQENLKRLKTSVEQLSQAIVTSQQDRDDQFAQVLQLTDKLNQSSGVLETLEERNRELAEAIAKTNRVLLRYGLSQDTPLHNVPPTLEGEVSAVGNSDLVEVSLGSDSGLRVGHQLEVHRPGGSYLGRLVVVDADANEAVARIQFKEGIIRRGDLVKTRIAAY